MAHAYPCLPVSRRRKRKNRNNDPGNPIDFDDIQSMDASEYLSRVVQEASTMPSVFVSSTKEPEQGNCKPSATAGKHTKSSNKKKNKNTKKDYIPIDGSAASLSYLVSERTSLMDPPTQLHLPMNVDWVDQTLANFSQLRLYLEKCHRERQKEKEKKKQDRQPVPPMKDRPGWHIFCVGLSEARGNTGSYFADNDDDNDDNSGVGTKRNDGHDNRNVNNDNNGLESKNNDVKDSRNENDSPDHRKEKEGEEEEEEEEEEELWKKGLPEEGFAPGVDLLLQIDQVMVRRVISHLVHYAQEGWCPCTKQRSSWLYALLARLERPIHRNDAAVLFGLLKELTKHRASLTFQDKKQQLEEPQRDEEAEQNQQDEPKQRQQNGAGDYERCKQREKLARLNVLIVIIGIYFEQGGGRTGVMAIK